MTDLAVKHDYASCIRSSEKVSWQLDDVMPEGAKLDFSRPFLPRVLAAPRVACLSAAEQLMLNHLGGNAYLNIFAFVEEFILATVVQHAQAELFGDHDAIRALVRFADEEVKHQRLFQRYRRSFDASFGHPAKVLETASEVAGLVLEKSPIGVMLAILHLELMTQDHYTQSVKTDTSVDPFFASLLEKHWMEESQHARIDELELQKLVLSATPAQLTQALDDYRDLLQGLDALLGAQAKMDLESLGAALGRSFTAAEAHEVVAAQLAGYRRTFLVAGIRNGRFTEILARLSIPRAKEIAELGNGWATT